jgi:hypothetical protein
MKSRQKKWGFVIVGAVAAVALGAIAVASAATSQSGSPVPSASSSASAQGHAPDFDGDGPRGGADGGRLHGGGPGDLGQALAELSGRSESAIMQQRASGKSYSEIAKAYGVDTTRLLAEATRIETAELDAAVKAGQMTAAERTQELSGLQARLKAALTETRAFGDGGHGCGRDGDGPQGSTGSARSSGATGAGYQTAPSASTTRTF